MRRMAMVLLGVAVGLFVMAFLSLSWFRYEIGKNTFKEEAGVGGTEGFFTQRITNSLPFPVYIEKMSFGTLSPNAERREGLYERIYGGVSVANPSVPDNFRIADEPVLIMPGKTRFVGAVLFSRDGREAAAMGSVLHCRVWRVRFTVSSRIEYKLMPR